jgi:hypothetical protein
MQGAYDHPRPREDKEAEQLVPAAGIGVQGLKIGIAVQEVRNRKSRINGRKENDYEVTAATGRTQTAFFIGATTGANTPQQARKTIRDREKTPPNASVSVEFVRPADHHIHKKDHRNQRDARDSQDPFHRK